MSLIRSEHINDQAIKVAKDRVKSSEAALEEARTQLEKRERAQYHEEQIWSDTIRRNSTWVTFGLMGVNIFLLLLSLAILEPWRRRRMVREIKGALEAQKIAAEVLPTSSPTPVVSGKTEQDIAIIEAEIDKATDGASTTPQLATPAIQDEELAPLKPTTEASPASTSDSPFVPDAIEPPSQPNIDIGTTSPIDDMPEKWLGRITWTLKDVISERIITIRRIDYTTAILQGAASGAVITASLIAMWRPT